MFRPGLGYHGGREVVQEEWRGCIREEGGRMYAKVGEEVKGQRGGGGGGDVCEGEERLDGSCEVE